MGNKQLHDAEYFPFYAKDGRTLFILQTKFDLAGIGFFTQLMRTLCTTPYHFLDLSDPIEHLYVLAKLGAKDEKIADEMLDVMAETGKIDKKLWSEKHVIFSQDFVDSLKDLYDRRKDRTITVYELYIRFGISTPEMPIPVPEMPITGTNNPGNADYRDNMSTICEQSTPEMPQSIVKDSKGEESKAKETATPSFSVSPNGSVKSLSGSERIETARGLWNSIGCTPGCQRTVLNFSPDDLSECIKTINSFPDDLISEAIRNYEMIQSSSEHELVMPYGSFQGFLKGGVDKFVSSAKPLERYKKRTQGQKNGKQGMITNLDDIDF